MTYMAMIPLGAGTDRVASKERRAFAVGSGRVAAGLFCAGVLSACGTAAINLQPESVPPDHGAAVGQVRVFKGDSEVTGSCYVQFTDQDKELKAALSLDDSGWVFTPLRAGPTYLSFVSCVVWNGLDYGSRQLRFELASGRTTYFGHLEFHLADRDQEITGQAIASSATGMPATSLAGALVSTATVVTGEVLRFGSPDGRDHVTVADQLAAALLAYSARYGRAPEALSSIAGRAP
jgi:hypothetical protein